jgi:tetratricopeptide (TPR) repeat protein
VNASLRQEELRGIAMTALQDGDRNRAIAAMIAMSETPEMSELKASGVLLLADLYHTEGNTARAVAVLSQLIEAAPPMVEFEFVLGRVLFEDGQLPEAEAHFRRAIEMGPAFLQTYIYLGNVLLSQDRQEEAGQVYAQYESLLAQLLAAVSDSQRGTAERVALLDQLSYATPDQRISLAVAGLLSDPSLAIQAASIQLLANVGTLDAVPALQAFAQATSEVQLSQAAQLATQQIALRLELEPAPIEQSP